MGHGVLANTVYSYLNRSESALCSSHAGPGNGMVQQPKISMFPPYDKTLLFCLNSHAHIFQCMVGLVDGFGRDFEALGPKLN